MSTPPGWFRGLLALLPRDFRREHGEEICELATRYAEGRSAVGRAAVWVRAAIDLMMVAAQSRRGVLDGLGRDIRYGLRSLRRDLGFALFAVGIVGFGVGASVTVFGVARALLLRPLPFMEPERLVWISNGEFGRGERLSNISVQSGQLEPLRNAATQFIDVGGYHLFDREGDHTLRVGTRPLRATRLRVTENFFAVLGVTPMVGRLFDDDEVLDDSPPVILLTHGGWLRFFSGAGDVVGSSVELDDGTATVIGILPPSFDFTRIFTPGSRIDYVAPFPLSERSNRTGNTLGLIGRLAADATIASAQAEAEALVRTDLTNDFEPVVRPLREHLSGSFRPALLLLTASVLLVMLMVCANLSNLLLARGAARQRELSIRAAIGAGRKRLVQQLLTESLILGLGGALLGIVLALNGTRFLASLDLRIPMLGDTRVDATALLLALGASVGVTLLFGVAPAVRGTDVDPNESLKDGARGASEGRGQATLRRTLVVSQVAIACLLLVSSALTVRSLVHLVDTDLGYDPSGRIALRIDPSTRFASDAERVGYYAEVLGRVREAPGIAAAGLTDVLPMAFNRRWDLDVVGRPDDDGVYPFVRVVSEGYLAAMGLDLLAGRDLTTRDGPAAPRVGLINEALAEGIWGDESPVGALARTSGREFEVIGVVRSTRQVSVDQVPGPEIFLPIRQLGDQPAVHLIVRGDRPAEDLIAVAREAVRGVAPSIPLDNVVSLDAVVGASLAPKRFLAWLLGGFALFALVLAALGIYAVIAYSVTQRRREIGIHVALGATNALVARRLVRESMAMTAVGLVAGLALSLLAARTMQAVLFEIEATDPVTLTGVAVVLLAVSGAASWIPARRALAVSPVEAVSGETRSR